MKKIMMVALLCVAAISRADETDPGIAAMNADDLSVYVESVEGNQRWPWNGLVDIDFTIKCPGYPGAYGFVELSAFYESEPGVTNDLTLTSLTLDGAPLSFPWATTAGTYRVTWNAGVDAPSVKVSNARYRVKVNMARYMVLTGDPVAKKVTISYLESPDYKDGETVWKDEYKTSKMALRLIQPHANVVGSGSDDYGTGAADCNCTNGEWVAQRTVRVTRPYYIGIFQVTREQSYMLCLEDGRPGAYSKNDLRPRKRSYNQLRGSFADGINWPKTGSKVSETSSIGLLRKCSGDDHFDLPTDAEWELAARAGYATALNSGKAYKTDNNANRSERIYPIAQCTGNVTTPKTDGKAQLQEVGLKIPSRWGLYDCHGNVYEYVLDVAGYSTDTSSVSDPVGPVSETEALHYRRGGSFSSRYHTLLIGAHRDPNAVAAKDYTDEDGFRLCWRFPTPAMAE